MTAQSLIEIKESDIRKHYAQAYQLLSGFDYAPRFGKPVEGAPTTRGRSPGIPGRRRFRSTTPGLSTPSAPSAGVSLEARIQAVDDEDPLQSETQAHVLRSARRAIAVAEAVVALYAELTPLQQMLQQNKQGRLAESQKAEFSELLSAASIVALFTFANMLGFLTRGSGEPDIQEIEVGDAEEIVLDDPNTALKGALWELDAKIARHADGDAKLAAVVDAFAETLMKEVALRAAGARQLDAFVAPHLPGRGGRFPDRRLHPGPPRRGADPDHDLQEAGGGRRQPHRQASMPEAGQDADGV